MEGDLDRDREGSREGQRGTARDREEGRVDGEGQRGTERKRERGRDGTK